MTSPVDLDELPQGWVLTRLGALGEYLNGRAFKSSEWSTTGRPIIRIQDLTGSNNNPNYFEGDLPDRFVVRPGDLLISWSATLGAYIWEGTEGVLNQHIFKVRSHIDKKFHYYLVRYVLDELERQAHGSGMVHVTRGVFDATPVLLPPKAEQQRIVALLDQIEAKRSSSAAHVAAGRRAIERLRQAVLAAACSGGLTVDWRDEHDLPSVRTTLEKRRAGRSTLVVGRASVRPPATSSLNVVPDAWGWATIGEVCDVQLGGTPPRKTAAYWNGGVPWVSSGEVANCRIASTRETISKAGFVNSNAKMYPAGTVLIAMIGEGKTRGQAAILDIEASTNQNVAGVLPDPTIVSSEYVWRWALAQYEVTRAAGRGGNQPALNCQKVRDLAIPLPPLEEQYEIVRRVDRFLAKADILLARLTAAQGRVDLSSQAILAKAFRGDLVATEAELALSKGAVHEPTAGLPERLGTLAARPGRKGRRKVRR